MSVAGVNVSNIPNVTANYSTATAAETKAAESKKDTAASQGAVYDKSSSSSDKKATYSVNKMSAEDRQALIKELKDDAAKRQSDMMNIVFESINGQAKKFSQVNDPWKLIASGEYRVDVATKKQAQEDIAEGGYYSVDKTAERIFKFASALAGDDEKQMKKMQAAFEKGYKQAEKAWGGDLPGISGQTKDAVNKMFEDYYDSKNTFTD